MASRVYQHSSRKFHFSPLLLATIGLVLVCLLLGTFSVYRYFRVVNIECTQDGQQCDMSFMDTLSMYKGRSLFETMTPKILGKKVFIRKKYPQTIQVHIQNQETLTTIFTDEARQSAAVVYTDLTMKRTPADALSSPSATLAITDLTLSALDDATVLSQDKYAVYTKLLEFCKTTSVSQIVIRKSDEIEIDTERKLTAIVSQSSLDEQLHSLQLLLVSPTIEQKPARVDLRFDRPVLQYSN